MHPQAMTLTGAIIRESSPDFSSLSPEELEQLEIVLQKQVLIENEQTQRLSGLRRTMVHLQKTIQNDQQRPRTLSSPIQQTQSILTSSDIVQCYICFSTIENISNSSNFSLPILCADCHRPVCRRCGNYTSPEFIQSYNGINLENQTHASKWRCRMCIVRREVVRKSGTWNTAEDETTNHSPVRLLQKLAAYRTSIASPSVSASASSSPSPSPQIERKQPTILSESTNFFTRLWRPSTQQTTTPTSQERNLPSSFDFIPEPSSMSQDTSPNLSSPTILSHRMSFIREVSAKNSPSNQVPQQSVSMTTAPPPPLPPPSIPPLQTQPTTSSTVTDPSFEDTTSEHPFDTASELLSQSFETNIYSSNPGILDDQDDDQSSREQPLTYDERHRRLSLTSKPMRPFAQQLSSLPMRITEQHHSESFPSPEANIDVSMAMDYFSVSMLTNESSNNNNAESILTENESASMDMMPMADDNNNNNRRQSSRSRQKNSESWARKRALMQRDYEWTMTLDREQSIKVNNPTADHVLLNNMKSLPTTTTNTLTYTNQQEDISVSPRSVSPNPIPSDLYRRRRSSRRLPEIPNDTPTHINSLNEDTITDDLSRTPLSYSPTPYAHQPLRENSFSNRSTRSKSIDSESSLKSRSLHSKLSYTHQTQNAKSVDISNLARRKSLFIVNNSFLPQRSLDYPCIVRKGQDLSDIVRRRMLYAKINKQQQGNNFSISLEREHIPKVPRKIIIRQDNSIEIALSKPPKLRRQTLSEDYYYGCNNEGEFAVTQIPNGSSTLGLPNASSIINSTSGDRRKTIETCENIYLHAEESSKLRARTPPSNPHRILLHRDKNDTSIRTNGLGMRIVGGQECEDGSLGCFVTNILSGGPADVQGNIEVGDQILEFNGHSLIDSTYEEVRILQDHCGDIVQLVVQHNNVRLQINGGQTLSSIEVSRHFETVPRLSSSLTRKRRNLPPLPPSLSSSFPKQPKRQLYETVETLEVPNVKELKPILINRGRLLAQIWHDVEDMKLALTIIQAGNLPLRSNGDQPYAYITGKMLFEDRGFDMFETKVIHSSNPTYNETFVFHEVETVDVLLLEVLLWDKRQPTQTSKDKNSSIDDPDEFIGMVQLPLDEANIEDEPRWYELRDRQTRKTSASSVTFKSSSAESSESFRKMPPLLKSLKQQERTKSSTDLLIRALNRSATNKRDIKTESPATKRKHSVVQIMSPSSNRKNLHRASIAGPLGTSGLLSNNDHHNNNDDDENDKKENNHQEPRRQSIITIQSEKLKRRISKGILKLFDSHTKHSTESISKSPPQSPTGLRKLSIHMPAQMDSEDDTELPTNINIDSSSIIINRSPRHSIVSTTHQDDQLQSPLIRPIPLQQMPIGQLMLPYIPTSRHSSISGSRKSSACSYCDEDEDIDRYFTFSDQAQGEDTNENNNVQTHTVGPGQVTPRNYDNMINDLIHMGQIQLGLIVTKGLLEIDIICARGLQRVIDDNNTNTTITEDNPPDTYVKTYLRTGTRRVQKRKTATIKASYNPDYHGKLTYNACNVMGRRLQVTVWQRARKFEKNQCIGEAFIQLDNLTLTQLTLAWYKLFREKLVESEFYDSS
ncbi:unnamed protein product [Adineta steineri]|uniref:Uncharacterized protein n=1 Tax=Adineta steineri TaxID=433720 RepID=A0A819HUQ2_9BILA|nr:unnamed protein product [Adineta steineri]